MAWSDAARRRSAEVRHLKALMRRRVEIRHRRVSRPFQERMLARHMMVRGGFTYNPISPDVPSTGIAVSIYGEREKPYTSEDFDQNGERYIQEFFAKNAKILKRPNHYVGGWHDTEKGIVYLDISVVVPEDDLDTAIDWGVNHNQESVYNLRTGETIYVKEVKKRRGKAQVGLAKGGP